MNFKEDFPILNSDIVYLDSGATTQKPKSSSSSSRVIEGNGTPLQYSCLENPMDGGVW